ncbi:MAG: alanine racemase [Gammaproteobacteria bacterium]|nr:alanine racemase [Gammaproteobacteria bacterium]
MTRCAIARIDTNALQHNLSRVRAAAPDSRVIAVVKADAYGHGLKQAAHALFAADAFGVARLDEALALREAGIAHRILLMEGVTTSDELRVAAQKRVQLVVHNFEQIDMLESVRLATPVQVWLKLDIGMHRLGFSPDQFAQAWQRLNDCSVVSGTPHIMGHFSHADDRNDSTTTDQLTQFERLSEPWQAERSVANSAAILSRPDSHYQWVRPGIMLYGVSPFVDGLADSEDLMPVMHLSTQLIAVQHLRQGEAVGYGGTWRCPNDMRIGIAAIGYGDGYPRHAESGTPVLVNDQRSQIIGRVSMDMLAVDLRQMPEASVGDTVTLWGDSLPVEEVAEHAKTIAYELLCGVTRRVDFKYS